MDNNSPAVNFTACFLQHVTAYDEASKQNIEDISIFRMKLTTSLLLLKWM